MSRARLALALAAASLALLVAIGYAYGRYRRASAEGPATVLPAFVEPGAGPRAPAPSSEAFGLRVGRSTVADAEALARSLGLACEDTSIRALMGRVRRKKAEEALANGEDPDVVSGASWNRPSKRERNPQVRLACEGTRSTSLRDWTRPASEGRLLFVFDSPEHPLRHASFQRTHASPEAALDDVRATAARYEALLGAPTASKGGEGAEGEPMPRLAPLVRAWSYADLSVEVEAIHYGGGRGTTVSETVEVPLPIRPDAPALPYSNR